MAVRLHRPGYDRAKRLIGDGHVVLDGRDEWSEDHPTAGAENEFIAAHGYAEYGRWHLAVDDERPEATKTRYKFPFGDLSDLHRCAVIAAESRAGELEYADVEEAAADLHEMLEERRESSAR